MFDISWGELLVIGIVALIVIGPQQLPGALRGLGRTLNKLRGMAGEFRAQFDDAMREAELHDVAKDVSDIKSAAAGGFNPVETIRNEIRDAVDTLKGRAADVTGVKEAQNALDDVNATLKAADNEFKAESAISALMPPPAPHVVDLTLIEESAKSVQIEAPVSEPETVPIAPPPKPRRKKAPAKPAASEGETP